jgi:hypothetical protein
MHYISCLFTGLLLGSAVASNAAAAVDEVAKLPMPDTANFRVIDMHFHTLWQGPNMTHKRTGLTSAATPEEMVRRNVAALNRNHVVQSRR